MNRQDILQMGRQAGSFIELAQEKDLLWLERFAALVASAEREECKKLCTWKTGNQFVDEAIAVCYRAIDQRGQA
jgi:hypothetical protein